MFTFSVEASTLSELAQNDVWALWTDVPNWPKWDPDLQTAEISGTFANGSKVTLKPKSGPLIKGEIIDCIAQKCFTTISKLPLWSSIAFKHDLKQESRKTKIIHNIEFRGLVGALLYLFLGSSMKKNLDASLQNINSQVPQKSIRSKY